MGLVQLFRDVPCPDILARRLLVGVLADFRGTGHQYLMHLVLKRQTAWTDGTEDQVEAIDGEIREHQIRQQIPQRWKLDFLFSQSGYDTFGDGIMPFWTVTLIQICILDQYWEDIILGNKPRNPYLLPGFHPDSEVESADWLEDFRPSWEKELKVEPGEPAEPKKMEPKNVQQLGELKSGYPQSNFVH